MTAWSSGLQYCVLVVLLALLPLLTTAAPLSDQSTESIYPVADSTGCYYNYQHYDEGDRIITNEPCLNCTCHRQMLMCYLRVCPYTKAIGQDCTVEKRPDQCCPVITCPEVPVQLIPSSTPSTALGHLNEYGCFIDSLFYSDGARVPSNPNNPCELCYCIRNRTACVMQECTLNIEGCKPVYQEGVCCPVKYDCDHPEQNLLEDTSTTTTTTTEAPKLIFTTTLSPENAVCLHNSEIYADGALIENEEPCHHCYCMKGKIVCAVQECSPTPLDKVNCTAVPPSPGKCCPDTYDCNNIIEHELTTLYDYTTTPLPVDLSQTTQSTNQEVNEIIASATDKSQAEVVSEKESTTVSEVQATTEEVVYITPSGELITQGIASSESNEIPEVLSTTPKTTEQVPLQTGQSSQQTEQPSRITEQSSQQTEETTKLDSFTHHNEEEVTHSISSVTVSKEESTKLDEPQSTTTSILEHPAVTEATPLTTIKLEEAHPDLPQTEQPSVTEDTNALTTVVEEIKGTSDADLVTEKEIVEQQSQGVDVYNPVTEVIEPVTELVTVQDIASGTESVTETTEDASKKQSEITTASVTEQVEQVTSSKTEAPVESYTKLPEETIPEASPSNEPSLVKPVTEIDANVAETPVEEQVTIDNRIQVTEKLPTENVVIEEHHQTTEIIDILEEEATLTPENYATDSQPIVTEAPEKPSIDVVTEEIVTSGANIPIESHVNEKVTESIELSTNAVTEEYISHQEFTHAHEISSTESTITNEILHDDHTTSFEKTTKKSIELTTEQEHVTTDHEQSTHDKSSTVQAFTEHATSQNVPTEHVSTQQTLVAEAVTENIPTEHATTSVLSSEESKVTGGLITTANTAQGEDIVPSVTENVVQQTTIHQNEVSVTEIVPQVTEKMETLKPELVTEHLPTEGESLTTIPAQLPEKSFEETSAIPEMKPETEVPLTVTESEQVPEKSATEQTSVFTDKEHETEKVQIVTQLPEKSATEELPIVFEKEHDVEQSQVNTEPTANTPEKSSTENISSVSEKETETPVGITEKAPEVPEKSATEETLTVSEKEQEIVAPIATTKVPEKFTTEGTPTVSEKEHETEEPIIVTELTPEVPKKSNTEEASVVPDKEPEEPINVTETAPEFLETSATEETPAGFENKHKTEGPITVTETASEVPEKSVTEETSVVSEKEHETEEPISVTEIAPEVPVKSATEETPTVPEKEHLTEEPIVVTEKAHEVSENTKTEQTPVVSEKGQEPEELTTVTEIAPKVPEKSVTENAPTIPEKEQEPNVPTAVTEVASEVPEKSVTKETTAVSEKEHETESPIVVTETASVVPETSATEEILVISEKEHETEVPITTEKTSTVSEKNQETEEQVVVTETMAEVPEKSGTEVTPVVPEKEHETKEPIAVIEAIPNVPEKSATEETSTASNKEQESAVTELTQKPIQLTTEVGITPVHSEKELENEKPQLSTIVPEDVPSVEVSTEHVPEVVTEYSYTSAEEHPTSQSNVPTTEKIAIVTAIEPEESSTVGYVASTVRVDEKVVTVLPEAPTTVSNVIEDHSVSKVDTTLAEASTVHLTQSEATTKSANDVTELEQIPVEVHPEEEKPVTKVPPQVATDSFVTEEHAAATEQPSVVSPNEPYIPVVVLPEENQPNIPEKTTEKQHEKLPEENINEQTEATLPITENVETITEESETEYVPVEVIEEAKATTAAPGVHTTEEAEDDDIVHDDNQGEHPELVTEGVEEDGVPGEGKCLVEGQTYSNNSNVPPINHCQTSCKCISSILQCESVVCSPSPSNLHNCMPVYQSPDSCCPTYSCSIPEKPEIESDSHKMDEHVTSQAPKQESAQEVTEKESNAVPELPEITNQVSEEEKSVSTNLPQQSTENIPVEIVTENVHQQKPEIDEKIDISTGKPEVPTVNVPVKENTFETTSMSDVVTENVFELNTVSNKEIVPEEHHITSDQSSTEVIPSKEYPTTHENIPIKVETSSESELENEVTVSDDRKQTNQSPEVTVTENIEQSTVHISAQTDAITESNVITEKHEEVTETTSTRVPVKEEPVQPVQGLTENSSTEVNEIPEDQVTGKPEDHLGTISPEHVRPTEAVVLEDNEVTDDKDVSFKPETESPVQEHITSSSISPEGVSEGKPTELATELVTEVQTTSKSTITELEPQITEINDLSQFSSETPTVSSTDKLIEENDITVSFEKETTDGKLDDVKVTTQISESTESVPVHVTEILDSSSTQPEIEEKLTTQLTQTENLPEVTPEKATDSSTSAPLEEPKTTTLESESSAITKQSIESSTEHIAQEQSTQHAETITDSHITNEIPQYTEHTESGTAIKVPIKEEKIPNGESYLTVPPVEENITTEKVMHEVPISSESTTKLGESQVTESGTDTTEKPVEKVTLPAVEVSESLITNKDSEKDTPEQPLTEIPEQPIEHVPTTVPVLIEEQKTQHQVTEVHLTTVGVAESHSTERVPEEENIPEQVTSEVVHSTELTSKPLDQSTEGVSETSKAEQVTEDIPKVTELPLKPVGEITGGQKAEEPLSTELPLKPTETTEKVPEKPNAEGQVTELPSKPLEEAIENGSGEPPVTDETIDIITESVAQTSASPVTENILTEKSPKQPEPEKAEVATEAHVTEESFSLKPIEEEQTEKSAEEPDHTPEDHVTSEIPHSTEQVSPLITEQPESFKPSENEISKNVSQSEDNPVESVSENVTEQSTQVPEHQSTTESVRETESSVTKEVTKEDGQLFTSGSTISYSTVPSVEGELSTSVSVAQHTEANRTEEATTPSVSYSVTAEQVTELSSTISELLEHTPEAPDYHLPNEEDYGDEDQSGFGPGTCRYGGKFYVSAQQIPRDDPCDFCFCFRSDIICLQQSCPPPIPRCHEEPIRGFCCPRYECPVSMGTSLNYTTTTTTTTTTLPPHFSSHAYKGRAKRQGCHVQGRSYQVGEEIKSASGPCLQCTCGGDGQMKCDPKVCSPEPMLRKMIAEVASRRRR